MAAESYIQKVLSGKWLVPETFTKNYKLIILLIVMFVIMIYQQYRVEALYVKTMKYRQTLKVVRTEFIYSSVELMNTTLETAVIKKVNERIPGLKIPEKKPVVITIPPKN